MEAKIRALFQAWKEEFIACREELESLDSVGGDGDLGIVLMDGFTYVEKELSVSTQKDLGKLFYMAGKLFNQAASSSMGTLISCGYMEIGKRLKGKQVLESADLVTITEGMADGVARMGKAKEGEKTFLDAIYPALRALKATIADGDVAAWKAASEAAMMGVQRAKEMKAVHGRLAFRQSDSIGIVDPGTMAAYHWIKAIERAVEAWSDES